MYHVNLERVTDKKPFEYTIVGSIEADPLDGKISDESPMGKALLGKKAGDMAVVETPKGAVEYKILSLE